MCGKPRHEPRSEFDEAGFVFGFPGHVPPMERRVLAATRPGVAWTIRRIVRARCSGVPVGPSEEFPPMIARRVEKQAFGHQHTRL